MELFPAMLPIGTFVLMAGQNLVQSSIIADKALTAVVSSGDTDA